jgi:type VI protein secretion system component VasF
MDEVNNNGETQPPVIKEDWKHVIERRWIISGFVRNGVIASFGLSLVFLTLYMVGSMPDTDFSDNTLFLLLRLLRYSSLILCAFALFAMAYSVRRMVNNPGVRNAFRIFIYFIIALIGAGLAMLYSFIVAASEGNVP